MISVPSRGSQFSKKFQVRPTAFPDSSALIRTPTETSPVRQLGPGPSWTPTRFAAAVRSAAEDSRRSREQSVPGSQLSIKSIFNIVLFDSTSIESTAQPRTSMTAPTTSGWNIFAGWDLHPPELAWPTFCTCGGPGLGTL